VACFFNAFEGYGNRPSIAQALARKIKTKVDKVENSQTVSTVAH
jgi:hypothetical protein